ncbi:class I SAM-dependent methyltransferase [Kribbella jiaozuonensis]|uniref:Class I SAM-dependent methyltransferase n=1 Tax=Kribbella jiaozuonensis TaxID=2575441 RepID=A0A4U3LTR5_9ACTN|nr:class I SAM-dependent methyltransferase [Kribbella jiaozuonensis]TKK77917.1 class I SAM-dependent methyltransferase [Kribbella jiaozuonensis]
MTDFLADIRTSYDTVATSYAELVVDGADWEDAAFDLLAKLVAGSGRAVLDVGCGPGRTTGLLAERGLPVTGIDLSPGMIEVARRDYPELDFRVGSMTALDVADGSVSGVVSWWSIIHLPRDVVPLAFAEFYRVLAPGGVLLMGFHVGSETTHKTSGYGGHPMNIYVHRWTAPALTELAVAAGFAPYLATEIPDDRLLFQK